MAFQSKYRCRGPLRPPRRRVSAAAAFLVTLFTCLTASMGCSADDLLYGVQGEPVMGSDGVQLRRAQRHFELARDVLAHYGWRSAPSKELPPSERHRCRWVCM